MSQKSSFVVALALTAFALTILGALITQVSNATDVARTAATATSAPAPAQQQPPQQAEAAPTLDASAIKAAIAEREASYQQLLDQANKQIAEANTQMQKQADAIQKAQAEAQQAQMRAQQAQAKAAAAAKPVVAQAPAKPAAPQFAVTLPQALDIAWVTTKGSRSIKAPELVEFEGKAAYEFIYANGSLYIDANSAKVLFTDVAGPSNPDKDDGGSHAKPDSKHEPESHDGHEDKD